MERKELPAEEQMDWVGLMGAIEHDLKKQAGQEMQTVSLGPSGWKLVLKALRVASGT